MYTAGDLRKGLRLQDCEPYVIVEFNFVKPKGQACIAPNSKHDQRQSV